MTTAFLMGLLSNLVCASGLALVASFVTKVWRNPHLAHALWILVLVKLLTPPIVEIPVPEFLLPAQEVNAGGRDQSRLLDFATGQEASYPFEDFASTDSSAIRLSPLGVDARPGTDETQTFALSWDQWLLAGWSLGTLIFVVVALRRHLRLLRVIAESQPADAELSADVQQIGRQMGLTACPRLCVTEVPVCPLVMGGWNKQVVLLPQRLLAELSRDQARAVLAHELAHVRRSDHLVRLFEILVLTLHWWNPLAWWTSRQLQQAEEECCDAWVVWALPEHRRTYGQTLLQTVEFLTGRQVLPVAVGTSFGRCVLERRIEMIMSQTIPRTMSRATSIVPFVAGVLVLPIAFSQVVSADPEPPKSNARAEVTAVEASARSTVPVKKSLESKQRDQGRSGVSTAEEASEAIGFFVAPVDTEFQKWRLQRKDVVAFAAIDGTSFIDMDTGTIGTDRFDFETLRKALKSMRKRCDPGTLKVLIEFGAASPRPEVDMFVEGAFTQMGRDAGFEHVEFLKCYQNDPEWNWKGIPQADGTHADEERLGNDALLAFPLRTPLGRYLAGGFDCFVDVSGPMSLDTRHILSDADKAVLREAFKSMDLPEDATVRLEVHMQRPKKFDTIHELPQVKKDAEFHRDAVELLRSVGFSQVLLAVNVSSVVFTSEYE